MESLWIAISVIALIVIVALFLVARKKGGTYPRPSNLALFGMTLVVLGIIFGDDRAIGYSFIGVGVLISVVDIVRNRKR